MYPRSARTPFRTALRLTLVTALASTALATAFVAPVTPASAATPTPPVPTGLPRDIEGFQPYVGQKVCDPVAKPGVRAFSSMLLNTYRDTSSLGIVRDCGIGGQSEHKEGRAWDWGVSVNNPSHVAEVNAVLGWLSANRDGHDFAMARRLGIMYMIWNKKIWKSYNASAGWQPYAGPNPHTDHVHFSFGWNGARQQTSYWTKQVAPVDYGPGATGTGTRTTGPVTPVVSPANIKIMYNYGATTLRTGDGGDGVRALQGGLRLTADGVFGTGTADAVRAFQSAQQLPVTGEFGPADWTKLFPIPTSPFGALEGARLSPGPVSVRGWAIDADRQEGDAPVDVEIRVDGTTAKTTTATLTRTDVAADYPGLGSAHGFATDVTLAPRTSPYEVCAYGVNAPQTPGETTRIACESVLVTDSPVGASEAISLAPGAVNLRGWTLDRNDTAGDKPLTVEVRATRVSDGQAAATRTFTTAVTRADVNARFPHYDNARRGYSVSYPLAALEEGSYRFCAVARNLTGTAGGNSSLGCRTLAVRHAPFGAINSVVRTPKGFVVRGWVIDPDTAAPTTVRVYRGSTLVGTRTANLSRPDVAAAHPGYGPAHGYTYTVPVPATESWQTLCVDGDNVGAGASRQTACRNAFVSHRPFGKITSVSSRYGRVTVRGWAIDPDTAAAVWTKLYVSGRVAKGARANAYSSTVRSAYPAYGGYHAFTMTSAGTYSRGSVRKVCVRGNDLLAGSGTGLVGCRTITIR